MSAALAQRHVSRCDGRRQASDAGRFADTLARNSSAASASLEPYRAMADEYPRIVPPHRRRPRVDLDEKITLASDVSAPDLLRRMLGVEDAPDDTGDESREADEP